MATVAVANTTSQLTGKTLDVLEADQTITGLKTFSRGTGAPFAVNSGATVVTNLDADLLDGHNASEFPLASDGTATGLELTNYKETKASASISAGALALNMNNGNHFAVSLNAAITSITISNVPASGKASYLNLIFTADGTARAITWPASVKWPSGTAPTMTSTNGKVDIITLYTVTGGTTWYGSFAQNY